MTVLANYSGCKCPSLSKSPQFEQAYKTQWVRSPRSFLDSTRQIYLRDRKSWTSKQGLRKMNQPRIQASAVVDIGKVLFTPLPGGEQLPSLATGKSTKVTIVGVGNVGMACAQTILTQHLCDEIALVDVVEDKLRGEMLDLKHASAFLPSVVISASTDYSITADSDVCIVTAGARQKEGEDRLSLVGRNFELFKKIIPELVKYSPSTILLIVSNPVDILAWVSWKLSGLPPNRVFGSGTNLDTSRLRFLVADHLNVHAQNVHAYILGEHGDSSVPLWSSISVAGVSMKNFLDRNGVLYNHETLTGVHKQVVDGAYEVIKLKGYTSWAVGYSVAELVKSLLRNQRHVHPVSVLAQGFHGIDYEVFLSLPCTLGRAGVLSITNSMLEEEERNQLQKSAESIWVVQSQLIL